MYGDHTGVGGESNVDGGDTIILKSTSLTIETRSVTRFVTRTQSSKLEVSLDYSNWDYDAVVCLLLLLLQTLRYLERSFSDY